MYRNHIRKNRVAGPSFNINVKYDHDTVAAMRGSYGTGNQSSLLPASSQKECYDIKEQEILVAKSTAGSMYRDGFTHVFSSVNGYDVGGATSRKGIKSKILNEVRFIGIATTEKKVDDRQMGNGLVATVGGVVTILNSGEKNIYPSDKVMLDLNLNPGRASKIREKGVPRQKVCFTVSPADDDEELIKQAKQMCPSLNQNKPTDNKIKALKKDMEAKKKIRDQDPSDTTKRDDYEKAKRALFQAQRNLKICFTSTEEGLRNFLQAYRLLNQRIIGTAKSFAKPGDRFEILLQPRSAL